MRESASSAIVAATIIPATDGGVSSATIDTVPAIGASGAAHPVVQLIQPPPCLITVGPEDQLTLDGRHVRTRQLAPRTRILVRFPLNHALLEHARRATSQHGRPGSRPRRLLPARHP
jgi:hypothetical protein